MENIIGHNSLPHAIRAGPGLHGKKNACHRRRPLLKEGKGENEKEPTQEPTRKDGV